MIRWTHIIFNPKISERWPILIALLAFVYASLSMLASLWLFPEYASIVMVFLTTIACIFVIEKALILEEKRENANLPMQSTLRAHSKIIILLLFLFLGFFFAFMLWTIVLPQGTTDILFSAQKATVHDIQAITGNAQASNLPFVTILYNNLRVLIIAIVFAVFYGAGAIFIIAWNASILGFVIGNLARNTFGISALPILFTKYFLHGIFEMLAYFIGALAGGILFVALVRGNLKGKTIARTLLSIGLMILIAVILLVVAAIIEVNISAYI